MLYLRETLPTYDRENQKMLLEELNQLSMDIETTFDAAPSSFSDSLSTETLPLEFEFDADAFDISPISPPPPIQQQQFQVQVTREGDRIPVGTDVATLSTAFPKPRHAAITAAAVTASFIVCRSAMSVADADLVQKRPRSPALSITGDEYTDEHASPSIQFLRDNVDGSSDACGSRGNVEVDDDEDDDDDVHVHVEAEDNNNKGIDVQHSESHRRLSSPSLSGGNNEQQEMNMHPAQITAGKKRWYRRHQHHPSSSHTILNDDPASPRSVTIPVSSHSPPSKVSKLGRMPSATASSMTTASTKNMIPVELQSPKLLNKSSITATTSTVTSTTCSSAFTSSDTMMTCLKDEMEDREDALTTTTTSIKDEYEDICIMDVGSDHQLRESPPLSDVDEKQKQPLRKKELTFHTFPSLPHHTIVHPSPIPSIITNTLACAKDPNTCRQRRAEAMERFRRKKAVRCYGRRVRYQIRKRIATTRPRVNGRFAKRSDLEAVVQPKPLHK